MPNTHLPVQLRPAVRLHLHPAPHLGQPVQVYARQGQPHLTRPHLRHHLAPRVHHHRVAVAAPPRVVVADLRRGDHIALSLDGPGPEQGLPVRLAGRHGEGGGEGE
jgi:hypothetical protein